MTLFIGIFIFLFSYSNTIYSKSRLNSKLLENVSVTLNVTGDISGVYDLSGSVNQTIAAESETGSRCNISVLFRKVNVKEKTAVEVWPTFNCIREGQTNIYKLHRIFLDLDKEVQKVSIKELDKKVQNLVLDFRDLSLQKGK
jgi:hypothetical protein